MAYVIVKAANTPRPGNWILERSIDGVNYKPWQYYAVSDSECLRLFGVPPTRGIPHYKRDDDVICTSRYSKLNPLENGEVREICHWARSLFVFYSIFFFRFVCNCGIVQCDRYMQVAVVESLQTDDHYCNGMF